MTPASSASVGEPPLVLKSTALIAAVGGVASVALTLRAGRNSPQHLVMALMSIWVVSPFAVLLLARAVSTRWPVAARLTLFAVTLLLALASPAIYATDALKPAGSPRATLFVAVPPVSWLIIAVSVGLSMLASRRPSAREEP